MDTRKSVTVVTSPTLSQRTRKDWAPSGLEAAERVGYPPASEELASCRGISTQQQSPGTACD
jgi:hypothetical protein